MTNTKMILISHRGNLNGRLESYENEPNYIELAILKGYDVEVDVWYIDDVIYLGHDKPQYVVNIKWFIDRHKKLWIHCKNIESLYHFSSIDYNLNYFWHQSDDVTLTSNRNLWTFPGKTITDKSIIVLPEQVNYSEYEINNCYGICSDYIEKFKTN